MPDEWRDQKADLSSSLVLLAEGSFRSRLKCLQQQHNMSAHMQPPNLQCMWLKFASSTLPLMTALSVRFTEIAATQLLCMISIDGHRFH